MDAILAAELFAADFRLSTWRLTLKARRDFDLGRWPAGVLRGAAGAHLLRRVGCPFEEPDCEGCDRLAACAWPRAFRPLPGADDRYRNPPAPFVLAWPGRTRGEAGHTTAASLTLVGAAVGTWPHWRAALSDALATGLGQHRASFEIVAVDALAPPRVPRGNRLGVRLLTPLELVRRGQRLDRFDPAAFLEAVFRRLDLLQRAHDAGQPLNRDLIRATAELRLADDRTRLVTAQRYSRTHDDVIVARGLLGTVVLEGHLEPIAPLLALTTRVGVGSGAAASWGCGRVAFFDPERDPPHTVRAPRGPRGNRTFPQS